MYLYRHTSQWCQYYHLEKGNCQSGDDSKHGYKEAYSIGWQNSVQDQTKTVTGTVLSSHGHGSQPYEGELPCQTCHPN